MEFQEIRQKIAGLLEEIRNIKAQNDTYVPDSRSGSFGKQQQQDRRERLEQIKQELAQLSPKRPSQGNRRGSNHNAI
jgi:predicted metal-dependent phosphoesterase TrpH